MLQLWLVTAAAADGRHMDTASHGCLVFGTSASCMCMGQVWLAGSDKEPCGSIFRVAGAVHHGRCCCRVVLDAAAMLCLSPSVQAGVDHSPDLISLRLTQADVRHALPQSDGIYTVHEYVLACGRACGLIVKPATQTRPGGGLARPHPRSTVQHPTRKTHAGVLLFVDS
jgi:hypothetical protein